MLNNCANKSSLVDIEFDRRHLWHPYTSLTDALPCYGVKRAQGVMIELDDGRQLVDGMSSWWAAIHGYNNSALNNAATQQLEEVSHVMFGGLTHRPAVELGKRLIAMTPPSLDTVFLADSGSVSVEVAIKMALQFQVSRNTAHKNKLMTIRSGYHGDTFAAMSVCDPVNGMHGLFQGVLPKHIFASPPALGFDDPWDEADIEPFRRLIQQHHNELAAVILEPVVQGAGGMRFYHPNYLRHVRELCDEHDVLLICDEIATGFGRTGKLFACEHADIEPDIMCVGKALSGGYVTLAATLATREIADVIGQGPGGGALMHGPTFMGNPLACAIACASLDLIEQGNWKQQVPAIETQLKTELRACVDLSGVADVRVLGAIGVVEMEKPIDVAAAQQFLIEEGVWIRPFGRLLYIMPPYIIKPAELARLTQAMYKLCFRLSNK